MLDRLFETIEYCSHYAMRFGQAAAWFGVAYLTFRLGASL